MSSLFLAVATLLSAVLFIYAVSFVLVVATAES